MCNSRYFTLFIPVIVLISQFHRSVEGHKHCGHSIGSAKLRTERDASSERSESVHQHPTRSRRQELETVELQIIIDDDPNSKQLSDEFRSHSESVEARAECSRSSRFSGDQQANCDIKTIETAVFIDQALGGKFVGLSGGLAELNKLVLTIMSQVQHLFSYSSMKVPIEIKLVLIEHLKDSDRSGLAMPDNEQGDIDAYLSNFCNWQQARLSREKRLHWDHAILLSGLDLYKATQTRNHTGVLGLAWVGGMCKGNYSCTINEATNLESAFVIAHEIGHSLGIMHDGQRNNCDPNGFLMSERTGAGKVHWSRCSNSYLNSSIQRRQLSCLETQRNHIHEPLYDLTKLRPPGQVYAVNEQCKLAFGNNYTSFVTRQQPFNAVCRELWCVAGTWAKAAHPALEGSSCGEQGRVCREGKCVGA